MRFFWEKNSGGTTLVYLPIDNWPRRGPSSLPVGHCGRRPSSSSLLLCTHACECDCSPSSMGCDAMPCHACTPPSCVFSRLSSSRTHRDRARQRHPALQQQPATHALRLRPTLSPVRVRTCARTCTLFTPVPSDQCCTHSRGVPMHAFPA